MGQVRPYQTLFDGKFSPDESLRECYDCGMSFYRLMADLVLILHSAFIAFVVLGLVLVVVGIILRWSWVRNFWFRMAHLAAILLVVVQSYVGMVCPLTTLERALRVSAGQEMYVDEGFIEYWLHRMIFFRAESWVFTLCYTLFGLAVAATFIFGPPRWPTRARACLAGEEADLFEDVDETPATSGGSHH